MRILHLSDTHLYGDDTSRHYGRIDTSGALRGVLGTLAGIADVDVVVHTGDASEDGSEASYRALHALLDPFARSLGADLAIAMGNHDLPENYARVAGEGESGGGRQDRVVPTARGGRVVVLDSTVPRAGYGRLEAGQLEWLRDVLAQPAAGETVLALHHPPVRAATRMLRALDLDGQEDLARVLEGSDVRVVLAGHYHHEMSGQIAGIPVHVAPGITGVVDPLSAGERERALPLSGASVLEVGPGPGALRVLTSVWPNAGDTERDPERPVYDFGPEEIRAIVDAAGH